MEKKNQLILEIEGKKITSNKFKSTIKSFFDFVDEISSQITAKKKPILWIVSVGHSSVRLNLSPEVKKEDRLVIPDIIKTIENGINTINTQDVRPKYYSDDALKSLRELASIIDPTKEEINSIKVFTNGNKNEISTKAIGNVDSILQIRREELGSIEGKLEVISSRRGLHFVIYDSLKNRPVTCYFKDDFIEKVLTAFNKRVYVFGLIKYRRGGIPYSIQIEKFRIFRPQSELPTPEDVLGIIKDIN